MFIHMYTIPRIWGQQNLCVFFLEKLTFISLQGANNDIYWMKCWNFCITIEKLFWNIFFNETISYDKIEHNIIEMLAIIKFSTKVS